jgi:glycosyltransferase involved in cell wall biosynthesis
MRILIITTSSGSRGGGELSLLYLAQGLKALGHELGLWASSHSSMDELCLKFEAIGSVLRANYTNTYQRKLRNFSAGTSLAERNRIKTQWLSWKPDILHLNKQNLEDGLDLLKLVNEQNIPSVCMIHITQSAQWLGAQLGWIRDWLSQSELRKYSGKFVTTPVSRAKELSKFLNSDQPIKVINNGVPVIDRNQVKHWRQQCREELMLEDQDVLFISVGRLVDQKKPLKFLQVAEEVLKELPNAKFIWVGDGNLRSEWNRYVKERNLNSLIRNLGWQQNALKWLAAGDVYLHTAKYEGMPFAVLEALSVGLPCLINEDLLKEIPEFNRSSILSLESDLSRISDIAKPDRLKQLSSLAYEVFEENFSIARMAKDYEKLYQSLLL